MARAYFLPKNIDDQIESVQICCQMFMDTLGISYTWIKTANKKKKLGEGFVLPDGREKKVCQRDPVKTAMLDGVRKHIESFPAVDSHYVRKNTTRKYLDGELNVARMHQLYMEKIKSNGELKQIIINI